MPVAEAYCNPSLLTGGIGTTGSPYGDIQLALDSFIHNGSGMRLNILNNQPEYLTGVLNPTGYILNNGPPLITEPLILQGYNSVPGDGGSGYINGVSGGCAIWGVATSGAEFDFLTLTNLHLLPGNIGGYAITCDNQCSVKDCYISGNCNAIDIDNGIVDGCTIFYSVPGAPAGSAVNGVFGAVSFNDNYIKQITGTVLTAAVAGCNPVINNIVDLTNVSGNGCALGFVASVSCIIQNNTILSNASGSSSNWHGIKAYQPNGKIENNYVRGFSVGVDVSSASYSSILQNNEFYNNGVNIRDSGVNTIIIGGSGSLISEGVVNFSAQNFTPTSDLIDAGAPTGFIGLSTRNYSTVGAINTQHSSSGAGSVNPLGGFLII